MAEDLMPVLTRSARAVLGSVQCPRSVDFRADLPRTDTGKLYKRRLRDEYWRNAGRAV